MNTNIAYFIGVLHSDGSLYHYLFRNRVRHRFELFVGERSLPMLRKTRRIISSEFSRKLKIMDRGFVNSTERMFSLQLSVTRLLPEFQMLGIDKSTRPLWLEDSRDLFCAYLAGVIDGDGDITIRKGSHPRCRIRITAGEKLVELAKLVQHHLSCGCCIEPFWASTASLGRKNAELRRAYKHSFLLSPKNKSVVEYKLYPHLTLRHKKQKLLSYLKFLSEKEALASVTL